MHNRIYYTFLFLSLLLCSTVSATPQRSEILHWNSNVYRLVPFPLDTHPNYESLQSIIESLYNGLDTDCGRGYVGIWQIIDQKLYLESIQSCEYPERNSSTPLQSFFTEHTSDEPVIAEWYSGILWASHGELIYYDHSIGSILENEIKIVIENGTVIEVQEFTNSVSIRSPYSENPELLKTFIYSVIDWDAVPELPDSIGIRVRVQFNVTEDGKPTNLFIVSSQDDRFNEQAILAVGQLPSWNTLVWRGKVLYPTWQIPVIFSKENRLQNESQ